jgi:uncharacterized protein YyaL (SSP411 family)
MRNRLNEETSPYLLQHAANPVHWHAWNDESLAESRETGKPILLSVGYSACHWCHVMAHESFEDADTARLMNELFINIKVDREERPDIDKIYQTSHQLMSGQAGGWPLTVFLTPDQVPIFTGTYFPKVPRYGMPAFRDVLSAVNEYYRGKPEEIRERGRRLIDALGGSEASNADDFAKLSRAPFDTALHRLQQSYDSDHGGFGFDQKFPHPTTLALLLSLWHARPEGEGVHTLAMVTHTLDHMAERGLFDHLGGGFFRYTVDRFWSIPHFEKMLYDNAQLLAVYADAYAATGRPQYASVAGATADWVMRDMQDPRGGFYSTLDADSEHEEGKFYVWTPEDFDAVLDAHESAVAKRAFGLESPPNFEGKLWHLHRVESAEAADELAETARRKLLAARERRVWPGRDDKIIVSWNGLMIAGLARAARILNRPDLEVSATRAVDFIRAELWHDGRLKATYKDGRARFAGYLDDYAFLAYGLIELLQTRWRDSDLAFAQELADVLLEHFEDPRGGFFFTADDHERLIHKPKPVTDEAVPAGNGVAALALLALGHLLGEQRYVDAAERTVRSALVGLERYPEAHATLSRALEQLLTPPKIVVLRGTPEQMEPWLRKLGRTYDPQRLAVAIPNGAALSGLLAARAPQPHAVAYVCEGMTCRAPLELRDGVDL